MQTQITYNPYTLSPTDLEPGQLGCLCYCLDFSETTKTVKNRIIV